MKPLVLLLNPPGTRPYIRNYFCAQTSKASFINQPIDFLVLGAVLKEHFRIQVLDAILEGLSPAACLKAIREMAPQSVIFLSGLISWSEDAAFLRELKKSCPVLFIGLGDIFLENSEEILRENPYLDGIILDFTSPGIRHFLDRNFELVQDMVAYCADGKVRRFPRSKMGGFFEIPVPPHELLMKRGYTIPFTREREYTTVLTDFGCPFKCRFCVIGTLGFKQRPVENVLPELDYIHSLGIREIFFIDQSFGVNRERLLALLQAMIQRNYAFGWICYSRADLLDEKTLSLMKKAGCHTIMFGVENASEELLQKYQKGLHLCQFKEIFSICRRLGLRTVGTFLLGLPEDTRATCEATIQLAIDLDCDFASFNVAFPRPQTNLRQVMKDEALFEGNADQAGNVIGIRTRHLSSRQLATLYRSALRRFYFRPRFLFRQLSSLKSFDEFRLHLSNGFALLGRVIAGTFKRD